MSILPYDRTILRLSGKDTRSFLQGITTQDIHALDHTPLIFTAFLSPQGKLLFDGFLSTDSDALLLDLAAIQAEPATTYLKRYKLRADVAITPTDLHPVFGKGHPDPRHPSMPPRAYHPLKESPNTATALSHSAGEVHFGEAERGEQSGVQERPLLFTQSANDASNYHTTRLTHALPESAYDSVGDDVAMDLSYDLLHAISFTKGCYVGQEVTARMHYKHIARRGIFHAATTDGTPLPPYGTPIMAGEAKLGELRSSQGAQGIGFMKFEPWEQAVASGTLITANSTPLILTVPQWAEAKLALHRAG